MKESKKNVMLRMFEEISKEENLAMRHHRGVVIEFRKNDRTHYVYSYSFGLNPTSVSKLCDNKRLASFVLNENNIPAIEHKSFKTKASEKTFAGNKAVLKYLDKHGQLVCKYNDGGGGGDIFKITSVSDLENLPEEFWENRRDIAFSPFYKLKNEYRVIVLDGEVKLIFSKKRQYVVGDGIKTIEQLMEEKDLDLETLDRKLSKDLIPEKDEKVLVNWQHNLAMGAIPQIVTDPEVFEEVKGFSLRIADLLNIKFASIDVARESNGDLILMEINAGVTLNRFAERNAEHYKIAKDIYREAILIGLK